MFGIWQFILAEQPGDIPSLLPSPPVCSDMVLRHRQAGEGLCSSTPKEKGALNRSLSPVIPDGEHLYSTPGSAQSSVKNVGKEKGNGIKALLKRKGTQSFLAPICLKLRLKM